ncbi:MAG: peptidyl-prolyl cis-trans isomerase [Lachnospiraceae bacterium]|nr:peptidyl-prolyl cis-trans isomerase [Lachnospiraceae bacterium]
MKGKKLISLLLAAAMGVTVLTGCGSSIDGDKTGATLDGEEISLGFMNFMARYQQAIYDGQFSAMFGADMWSQDLFNEGTDMETSVKNNVAENIETLYLLEDHMKDYNVEITEEELAEADKAADAFLSDNTEKAVKQVGATKEYVKEMLRLNTIQSKMRKAIEAEVDTEVSDEEAAQKTVSYVQINHVSTTDEEGNKKEYTEEEKEDLKKKIKEFVDSAKEDFAKAAEAAGYTVSNASYGSDEETLDKVLVEAADKLKEGELSGIITGDENYYVVRMDSTFDKEATEKKKESILEERKNDHYKEVCDGYKENVKFEVNKKEWEKVKFDDLFTIKQEETSDTEENADNTDSGADENTDEADNDADENAEEADSGADENADDTDAGTNENADDAEDTDKEE